jgi:hypothetical protein
VDIQQSQQKNRNHIDKLDTETIPWLRRYARLGYMARGFLSAKLLQLPFGHWLGGIAGIIITGYGFYEINNAYSGKYKAEIREWKMSKEEIGIAVKAGKIGTERIL